MSLYPFGIITSHMSESLLEHRKAVKVPTPWGDANLYTGQIGGINSVVFLRYGDHADQASHLVNFRANLWGMRELGVTQVVSQNAIGSCNPHVRPGDFMVPDDAMDFTKNRVRSFFENDSCWVRVDMMEPFCGSLRKLLLDACAAERISVHPSGTFVCTEGPRFETPAEIRFYGSIGGDIIGTPLFPEVVLAKEAGMCYASLSIVINMGTGLGPAIYQSGDDGLMTVYERTDMEQKVENILRYVAGHLPEKRTCKCPEILEKGFWGKEPDWMKKDA